MTTRTRPSSRGLSSLNLAVSFGVPVNECRFCHARFAVLEIEDEAESGSVKHPAGWQARRAEKCPFCGTPMQHPR